MKIKFISLLILLSAIMLSAQNLDSIFTEIKNIRTGNFPVPGEYSDKTGEEQTHRGKCGLDLFMFVRANFSKFTPDQQQSLNDLLTRPETETSVVTPSGFFRIHYDTSAASNHTPGFDMAPFIAALDSAYDYEINVLGFNPPPTDGNLGGDDKYDVYIRHLGTTLYGYTDPEDYLGDSLWTSYMVIENDYHNFYTPGLNGAKVTAAHEFHHAIQIGSYINRYSAESFYYEITSVAMEEFVFDYINDYYGYMKDYFDDPGKAMPKFSGYELGIWNIYLRERFGNDIIRRIWELMSQNNYALRAIELAIIENGSSLKTELNKFGVWTYFTGHRAVDGEFFEEGIYYPQISPMTTINFAPPKKKITVSSEPVSNNFIVFNLDNKENPDSIVAVVSNTDVGSAIFNEDAMIDFSYTLSSEAEAGYSEIITGYYGLVESSSNYIRGMGALVGDTVNIPEADTLLGDDDFAFPQPFSYSKHTAIKLPVKKGTSNVAELYIFTPSMIRVFQKSGSIITAIGDNADKIIKRNVILWDGLNDNGEKLATGVYIWVTNSDDEIKKGKLVIYND